MARSPLKFVVVISIGCLAAADDSLVGSADDAAAADAPPIRSGIQPANELRAGRFVLAAKLAADKTKIRSGDDVTFTVTVECRGGFVDVFNANFDQRLPLPARLDVVEPQGRIVAELLAGGSNASRTIPAPHHWTMLAEKGFVGTHVTIPAERLKPLLLGPKPGGPLRCQLVFNKKIVAEVYDPQRFGVAGLIEWEKAHGATEVMRSNVVELTIE